MRALLDVAPTPEQLALFSRIKPGVEIIRGAAGSGKTTTALLKLKASVGFYLNRMRRSSKENQVKVLVLTFNRTLRGYIAELAEQQFVVGENLSLEVSTFSFWAKELTQHKDLIEHTESRRILEQLDIGIPLNNEFKVEEAQYVLGRFLPDKINDYLTCRRVGRGAQPRMEKAAREALLSRVIIPYQEYKDANNLSDWNDLAVKLASEKMASYDVVVIDEAQDFSSNEIRAVMNQMATAHTATFVLDTAQRIYARSGFIWNELGLNVRPENSFMLNSNYRNTKQIAMFAAKVLDGIGQDDDGAMPNFENAQREGARPTLLLGKFSKQLDSAIDYIKSTVDLKRDSVAFLHPAGGGWFKEIRASLATHGIAYAELSRVSEWPQGSENVALSTMHSAKGLEFDHVIMIGLSSETMRLDQEDADDEALLRARRLVAMAVGRARKSVLIGYKPSEAPLVSQFIDHDLCKVCQV